MNRRQQIASVVAYLLCLAAAFTAVTVSHVAAAKRGGGQSAREADAAALYARHCDTCHGKDGRAKTFKGKFRGARDLTDARWQSEVTDERIFNSITQGRGKMPSFKKKLSAEQVESLVAYVRGLKK